MKFIIWKVDSMRVDLLRGELIYWELTSCKVDLVRIVSWELISRKLISCEAIHHCIVFAESQTFLALLWHSWYKNYYIKKKRQKMKTITIIIKQEINYFMQRLNHAFLIEFVIEFVQFKKSRKNLYGAIIMWEISRWRLICSMVKSAIRD